MKKFLIGVVFSVIFIANVAFAENFSDIVKIGAIGAEIQSPYHGFIVEGTTFNDGEPFIEEFERNGVKIKTYQTGTAKFGDLYCKYDFNEQNFSESMRFGGENNLFLKLDGTYKEIFRIDGRTRTFYAIYHNYCTTDLKILDNQRVFIDSKKLSAEFFGGNDGYKLDNSVIYDIPTCAGDMLIIKYRRWHWGGESAAEGEFRLKFDDKTQNFSIKQVIY